MPVRQPEVQNVAYATGFSPPPPAPTVLLGPDFSNLVGPDFGALNKRNNDNNQPKQNQSQEEEFIDPVFCEALSPASPVFKESEDPFSNTLDLLQDPRFLPTSSLDSFWAAALSGTFEQQQEDQLRKKRQKLNEEEAAMKKHLEQQQQEVEKQRQQLLLQLQQLQQGQQQQQQQQQEQQQQQQLQKHPQQQQLHGQPLYMLPNQIYQILAPDGTQHLVMAQPVATPPQAPDQTTPKMVQRKPRKPLTEIGGKNELKKSFYPRVKQRRGRKRKYVPEQTGPLAYEDEVVLGIYTRKERWMKIQRYRSKRATRTFRKKILYACRKNFADKRPRVGGRFVKLGEGVV